jgi:hypothetical protein
MSTIEKLEQELRKAKLSKQVDDERKKIELFRKLYVGKCYGSHSFNRNSKATWKNAFKILSIDDKGNYSRESVYICKHKGSFQYHFSTYTHERLDSNFHYQNIHRKVEITNTNFEKLKQVAIIYSKDLEDVFNGQLDVEIEETNGDHSDNQVYKSMMDVVGVNYIDMDDHKNLLSKLRSTDFPLLIGGRFLLRDKKNEICDHLISKLTKHMLVWGSKIRERDETHIKVIKQIKLL